MKAKPFDLSQRTYEFASEVRKIVRNLSYNLQNVEDGKQVVRSSGSVAANYIEANENLGDKDFIYRIWICRKEAKESVLWLKLLKENNSKNLEFDSLIDEADQLKLIFNSIANKKK
jgi:four helix bundle protein